MSKRIIYLRLKGRIGNQLFMFALARQVQCMIKEESTIIVDETEVENANWVDSLKNYNLKSVEFISGDNCREKYLSTVQRKILYSYLNRKSSLSYTELYEYEKKMRLVYNLFGLILCENGYMDYKIKRNKVIYIEGYFQSEKYFVENCEIIKKDYSLDKELISCEYPGLDYLTTRNSVCISIKVEHNVGSEMYDVCSDGYWNKAIQYVTEHVENPLFFICSDNVDYVKENLIDCNKYDVICQAKDFPVHLSLSAMSKCKHFIIGNTSFGWWAQYLADKQDDSIMIAPSKWMRVEMPIDIYQDGWTLIDVEDK